MYINLYIYIYLVHISISNISNYEYLLYLIALLQSYFLECEIAIHQVHMGIWHLAVSPPLLGSQ